MATAERRIGVSIISFISPFWTIPILSSSVLPFLMDGYLESIKNILQSTGLGIQLLPIRGMRKRYIKGLDVISYEGPWNCGPLHKAIKRGVQQKIYGYSRSDYPSPTDWVLFGSDKGTRSKIRMFNELFPKALPIDIPWLESSAIEIGPDMYSGNARKWPPDRRPAGIVLDTGHWEELAGIAESELGDLGGYRAVKMIHLKFRKMQEIDDFIHYAPNDLNITRLLRSFTRNEGDNKLPVIIEAKNDCLYRYSSSIRSTISGTLQNIKWKLGEVLP